MYWYQLFLTKGRKKRYVKYCLRNRCISIPNKKLDFMMFMSIIFLTFLQWVYVVKKLEIMCILKMLKWIDFSICCKVSLIYLLSNVRNDIFKVTFSYSDCMNLFIVEWLTYHRTNERTSTFLKEEKKLILFRYYYSDTKLSRCKKQYKFI